MRVRELKALDLPELEPYRTMKWQAEHRQRGIFVAEGEKVVRRLLDSRFTLLSVLLPRRWFEELESVLARRMEEFDVYIAPKEQLEALTGFSMYQGLLALARVPPPLGLEHVLARHPQPRFLTAVDGLTNAQNLGVVVRNSLAFGAQAMLVGETSGSPFLRRAVRSSMGAIFRLDIVELDNLAEGLERLRAVGVHCVAAHPHTDRRTLPQARFAADCCIVFGSEGEGLTPGVLSACNEAVLIPMAGDVDSLNVGSASAVFLYEAARQRGLMTLPAREMT
jgi:tRNA G18 (ribose-2'-O)-methylase SpoU